MIFGLADVGKTEKVHIDRNIKSREVWNKNCTLSALE